MKYIKSKVDYSTYCVINTIVCMAVFVFGLVMLSKAGNMDALILVALCLLVLLFCALWYAPVDVTLNDGMLIVRRPLKMLVIPVDIIKEIRMLPPTMGAIRLCGSGGFCGYWGWFREGDVGRYFAYFGKSSQCFFIHLSDGRKYMIGCRDSQQIVSEIEKTIWLRKE